jgi:hypothetical protein
MDSAAPTPRPRWRPTRRQALAGAAALALAGRAPAQELSSFLPTAIIDAGFAITNRPGLLDALRDRGVRSVFRYYAPADQPERGLPDKVLRPAEARALWDAGLSIGAVFQYNSDRAESITAARGREDARFALDYAGGTIGQPRGTAIYFGVDGSWSDAAQMDAVRDYFTSITDTFVAAGAPYRVGAYGSGAVLQMLTDLGAIELAWLALSRGWPGTRAFYNSGRWSLFQFSHHLRFGSHTVDGNAVNPALAEIGAFGRDGAVEPVDFADAYLLREQFHFLSTRKAPVMDRPGGRQIFELTLAYNPIVLHSRDGWHAVSLDGSDAVFGWVDAAHLTPSDQMPDWR